MNLYDDLGVRQGATPDEVREQYRVLVRLLHPDQFSDPVMKAAAEGQMRRVNEIVAVLTVPERLSQYETEALAPIVVQTPQAAAPSRRVPWNSLAWGMAAMICAGAIVWVSGHEAISAPPPAAEIRTVVIPQRVAVKKPVAHNGFSGLWLYARHPDTSGKFSLPEFIETNITERDGKVRGRYHSRYHGTDEAISPPVNFEFTGQADGESAQMPFTSDDGSRGEVRLRLISESELELVWTATGASSPSSGGTTILMRGQ